MSNEGAVIALIVVTAIFISVAAYIIQYVDKRIVEINKCVEDINNARKSLIRLSLRNKSANFHQFGDKK